MKTIENQQHICILEANYCLKVYIKFTSSIEQKISLFGDQVLPLKSISEYSPVLGNRIIQEACYFMNFGNSR